MDLILTNQLTERNFNHHTKVKQINIKDLAFNRQAQKVELSMSGWVFVFSVKDATDYENFARDINSVTKFSDSKMLQLRQVFTLLVAIGELIEIREALASSADIFRNITTGFGSDVRAMLNRGAI